MFSLTSTFRFVGEINGVPAPCNGDIVMDKATNEIKCQIRDSGQVVLGEPSDKEEKPMKMKPVICERCGGSFKGKKCFWCVIRNTHTHMRKKEIFRI